MLAKQCKAYSAAQSNAKQVKAMQSKARNLEEPPRNPEDPQGARGGEADDRFRPSCTGLEPLRQRPIEGKNADCADIRAQTPA